MEGEIADAAAQQRILHCFTQADVDAVLYGYLRAHTDLDMPLHSISGIKFIPYQYPQGIHGLLTPISPVPPLSPWLQSNGSQQSSVKSQAFFPPSPSKTMELPSSLAIRHLQIGNLFHVGVFSTNAIPQGTRLGPYTGRLLSLEEIDKSRDNSCIWEVFSNGGVMAYVDGTLDSTNWMKAINCARYKKEQNLIIIQIEGEVFYESMRDIGPGEELLVWYGNDYERYMDIPLSHKEVVPKKVQSISEDTEGE
eukprot:gene12467-3141_t